MRGNTRGGWQWVLLTSESLRESSTGHSPRSNLFTRVIPNHFIRFLPQMYQAAAVFAVAAVAGVSAGATSKLLWQQHEGECFVWAPFPL